MAVIIYPQMSVPPVCHNWPSYLHSDVCSPVPPKCNPPSAPPPARILGYSIIRIILQCSLKDMKQSIIRRQSCRTYFNSCFQPVCTLYIPQVKMSNLCLICQIIKLKKKFKMGCAAPLKGAKHHCLLQGLDLRPTGGRSKKLVYIKLIVFEFVFPNFLFPTGCTFTVQTGIKGERDGHGRRGQTGTSREG